MRKRELEARKIEAEKAKEAALTAQEAQQEAQKAPRQPEKDPFVSNFVENIIRHEKVIQNDSEKSYVVPFGMGPVDISKIDEVDREIQKYNQQVNRNNRNRKNGWY